LGEGSYTDEGLWDGEDGPIEMVEAICSIPGKLQMLSLIFTHGDMSGSSGILAVGDSLVARKKGFTYGQGYRPLEAQGRRTDPDVAGPGLPNAPG